MVNTRFRIKIGNAEVEMEGEQSYIEGKFVEVFKKLVEEKPQLLQQTTLPSETSEKVAIEPKANLEGIFEYQQNGEPKLILHNASNRLSFAEVTTLMLYAYEPRKLSLKELRKAVSQSWKSKSVEAFGSLIARPLKNRLLAEGEVGSRQYGLSGSGRDFAVEILQRLRNEMQKQREELES